jgi:hypothetical protein
LQYSPAIAVGAAIARKASVAAAVEIIFDIDFIFRLHFSEEAINPFASNPSGFDGAVCRWMRDGRIALDHS